MSSRSDRDIGRRTRAEKQDPDCIVALISSFQNGAPAADPLITPDSDYLFRDGGMEGDQVSELVATELPGVLEEGGHGTMTASWVVPSDDDPTERPRGWPEGTRCDAWIVHTSLDDPLATAAAWNRDSPPEQLDERLDRWLAYYGERKIEAVGYGVFVLRRRDVGSNWIRTCVVPRSGIHSAGTHLERLFAAQDFLGSLDDEELGRQRFRLHEDARLEHSLRPTEGGWNLEGAELVLIDGLPFRAGLDEATSAIVHRLGPTMPLTVILADAAAELGVDARPVSAGRPRVRQAAARTRLRRARELVPVAAARARPSRARSAPRAAPAIRPRAWRPV